MKYIGQLYGKISSGYFDTGRSSEDWDRMEDALKRISKLDDDCCIEKDENGNCHDVFASEIAKAVL